jgi:hypothetical protein
MTIALYNKILEFSNCVEYYVLMEYNKQINCKNLYIFDILTECYCSKINVPNTAIKIIDFMIQTNDK